ncbi:MAG TPA: HlyD family type I secretion periplasmic adaptor subunit [Gammaproteobacteria bacterium]|nr:HlyD family type I secretion periplasmic adaptor subunit [Gammaproteobacteria bacterium]
MSKQLSRSIRKADIILYTSLLFWVIMFLWSYFATLEEVTRGQGRVIASSKIQVIQNLEGGIVKEILVQTGDEVTQSQLLIKLDDTQFKADLAAMQQNRAALEANIATLTAESQGVPPVFDANFTNSYANLVARELELHQSRMLTQRESIEVLEQRLQRLQAQSNAAAENFGLIQQEQDIVAPLVEKGVESQMELIRLKQRLNEAQSNIFQIDAEIEATNAQLKAEQSSFIEQAREKLQLAKTEYNALIETMPTLEDRLERTLVRASMNAVVNRLLVNTIGGVVQPGSPMVELVPIDDELVVEVEISPKDIAYVIPGQRASIKLTAFDFAKFGALEGKVTKISADSISKEDGSIWYLCQVSVPVDTMTTLGKTIKIQTGMVAQVDIISGEKTVLQYLLQPVTKIANEAFRER